MGEQQVENEIIRGVNEIEDIVKKIQGPIIKPVYENLLRIIENIVQERNLVQARLDYRLNLFVQRLRDEIERIIKDEIHFTVDAAKARTAMDRVKQYIPEMTLEVRKKGSIPKSMFVDLVLVPARDVKNIMISEANISGNMRTIAQIIETTARDIRSLE